MLRSNRLVLGSALALAMLGGCSILAPSDDELMGGGATDAGKAGSGGKGGTHTGGATGGGTGGTDATAATGGIGASGGLGATGGGGVNTGGITAGGAAGIGGVPPTGGTGGVTCTPVNQAAIARPVAMYLLLDRSASMFPTSWNFAVSGVSNFVSDQQNSKMEVAFDYFPRGNTDCAGSQWASPTIPIAPLSQNAANIVQTMNGLTAGIATNLEGVLHGLATFGSGYAASHPDGQFSAVLVTDVTSATAGNPCTATVSALAKILADAWPAVTTYVARAPAGEPVFDSLLAAAGGTVDSVGVSSSSAVETALKQAAVSCRFEIPPGFPVASVTFTLDPGGTSVALNQVTTPSGCGTADGWFVSPTSAQTAVLCPASCRKHNTPTAPVAVQVSAICGA